MILRPVLDPKIGTIDSNRGVPPTYPYLSLLAWDLLHDGCFDAIHKADLCSDRDSRCVSPTTCRGGGL